MKLLKKLVVAFVAAIAFTSMAAPLANAVAPAHHATVDTADEVANVAEEGASLVISQPVWALVTIVLLPVLIGLSRKESLKGKWKWLLAAVVTVAVTIAERAFKLPDGGVSINGKMAYDVLLMFVGSQVALVGWDKFGSGARLAPKFGIG